MDRFEANTLPPYKDLIAQAMENADTTTIIVNLDKKIPPQKEFRILEALGEWVGESGWQLRYESGMALDPCGLDETTPRLILKPEEPWKVR